MGGLLRVSVLVLLVYGGLLCLTWWGFTHTPTGFIPAQDKGYLLVNVQLPDAASRGADRSEVMQRIEEIARETPGVKHTVAIAGQSILLNANAPNFGAMYVMLDDFARPARARGLSGDAIAAALQATLPAGDPGRPWSTSSAPPPVDGLGTAGGFKIIIEDRGDNGPAGRCRTPPTRSSPTAEQGHRRCKACSPASAPTRPGSTWTSTASQAKTMGVSIGDVFNTLQVYLGSLYVNDFNRFGRTWQVNVQADDQLPQAGRGHQAAARSATTSGDDGAAGHARQRSATSAAR